MFKRRKKAKPHSRRPRLPEVAVTATSPALDEVAPTWWGQALELTVSAQLKLRFQQLPDMDELTDAQKLEHLVTLWERAHAAATAEGYFDEPDDPEAHGGGQLALAAPATRPGHSTSSSTARPAGSLWPRRLPDHA